MASPLANDAYDTLQPYVPGKPVAETERELGISGVIKLASNENPLGPSPKAVAALRDALPAISDYPDGSAFYFKERLARHTGLKPENLIIGNGTNEVIELAVRTFIRPGEHLLYVRSSFIIYKLVAQSAGVPVREVPMTRDRRFDLDAILRAVTPETKLLFIDNPVNPTGTYLSQSELDAFLKELPPHVVVVLDEAYCEYAGAKDYPDGLRWLGTRERFLVTRTFSKCYGLAGIRVGYGMGDAKVIEYLNRGRQPFNTSALAQIGASAALDDQEHVRRSVELTRAEMPRLIEGLRKRGYEVGESQANFVWCDFKQEIGPVFQKLLREGVIIRPVANYGFPTAARITIGTAAQNERLLAAIGRVL
jgi:histidinol-phosphate aminotransferase